MKKILSALFLILMVQTLALSEMYCPTPGEYQDKLLDFQSRAAMLMQDTSADISKAEALWNEQEKYIKSTIPACVYYFKNPNTNYDCKKLQTLGASFMILDKDLQPIAKSKINKLPPQVQEKCPLEYDVMKSLIDDINK